MKPKIFDDVYSFVHLLFGLTVVLIPFPINLIVILLFIMYQVQESRTKKEIFYDIIEFFIGTIIGIILKTWW